MTTLQHAAVFDLVAYLIIYLGQFFKSVYMKTFFKKKKHCGAVLFARLNRQQ